MVRNVNIYNSSEYLFDINIISLLISLIKKKLKFSITSLDINFVKQEDIIRINKKYLAHDHSTDIITFNYSESPTDIDGELLISLTDAKSNSQLFKTSHSAETCRLVIHGILHVIGYDDVDTEARKIMKSLEDEMVNEFSFLFDKLLFVTAP